MRKYSHKNLNVRRILELGDLDVKGIAAGNGELTAKEYFSRVEGFIEDAPQFCELLTGITKLDENIRALKELEKKLGVAERSVRLSEDAEQLRGLERLKTVLTEIGYDALSFDIDSICAAIKGGDLPIAERLSGEVLSRLNILTDRLWRAYSVKRIAKTQDESKADDVRGGEILLSEALEYLDYEEENRKLRILAVDDVAVVLNMLVSVLSPYYEVFALKNSTQVEQFLLHTSPELFLLDIEMNGMSGFELVPLIRRFSEHKETPIIFLTGNASLNNLKDAISLGACDFITKPVDRDILLDKIQRNIVRRKAY